MEVYSPHHHCSCSVCLPFLQSLSLLLHHQIVYRHSYVLSPDCLSHCLCTPCVAPEGVCGPPPCPAVQGEEGGHGGGGDKLGGGGWTEQLQSLPDENGDVEADAVCLCSPGASPCCSIAPSFWTRMKLLSHPHPWCSCRFHPHCLSLGCKSRAGGPGRSWTAEGGCERWRAEGAGEEGLSGRSDLGGEEK